MFYFGTSGAGKAVNAQTAIQLSTVYACVRVISETVASLLLGVYEATDDGSLKAGEHSLTADPRNPAAAWPRRFVAAPFLSFGWNEYDHLYAR